MAKSTPRGLRRFLFENSIFLIAGASGALIWANADLEGYTSFIQTHFFGEHHGHGHEPDHGHYHWFAISLHHPITLKVVIDDVLMALFFAIAGKEVWEALLPGGPLSNFKKASMPLLATAGGMVGPVGVFLIGCALTGTMAELGKGWAVPTATDIAFSYLVARFIFGPGHTAIPFLLLLAIADDAAGLIILAVAYPQHALHAEWLLLTAAAVVTGFAMRNMKLRSFWWYLLIPGSMSWFSFYQLGVHPALGLVPIIPTMPHAHTDLGLFARKELGRHDTLNEFEHWMKNPVELVLGLFGLVNAGVPFGSVGTGTALVLLGLLLGKPLGVYFFGWVGEKIFKLELPKGMEHRHLLVVGMVAGLGFTVSLFVSGVAFKPGSIQDAVKMGALGSFAAAPIAIILARMLRIKAGGDDPPDES